MRLAHSSGSGRRIPRPLYYPVAVLILVILETTAVAQTSTPRTEVLPEGFIRQAYYYQLSPSQRGTPPWNWRLVRGTLPPGVALDHFGTVAGAPTAPGEFHFIAEAVDSSPTPLVETHQYVLRVAPPITLVWTRAPEVTSEGAIEGELEVTNGSGHTVDMTVIVVAVSTGGSSGYPTTGNKAFALGYQRFSFGTGKQRIPFGSTLPRDSYVVHADAVAEIAETLEIYRARLQTAPLTIP
jgi:hypothetical protein